jgi:16S rRNA (adenine1518-N6/adenine1519-N6)-dimethyltransferase
MALSPLPNYNSGPALRSFLEERGLSFRKQWGQNFLINPHARRTLAEALGAEKGSAVWEIGSGPGCMTTELLDRGMKVTAFEIDTGLCSILEELFVPTGNFSLVRGDVLKTWKTAESAPYLLGNLPYSIAALLMGNLIEERRFFSRMIITVQKEVALRMAAPPGSAEYSSISVLCASAYTMKILMTLKASSFYPVPRVDSAGVCFERKPGPLPPPLFYPLIRALFAARRKTIANNLENFLARFGTLKGGCRDAGAAALNGCGLTGRERAEKLSPEMFFALAKELEQYAGEKNGL